MSAQAFRWQSFVQQFDLYRFIQVLIANTYRLLQVLLPGQSVVGNFSKAIEELHSSDKLQVEAADYNLLIKFSSNLKQFYGLKTPNTFSNYKIW